MGSDVGEEAAGGAGVPPESRKEEEIGTRRQCMKALVEFAKCEAVRSSVRA